MLTLRVTVNDGGVWIGDRVKVHLIKVDRTDKVALAIEAPREVAIERQSVRERNHGPGQPYHPGELEGSRR